jgi:hypothetical protein
MEDHKFLMTLNTDSQKKLKINTRVRFRRTLGSWVLILLGAWMSVSAFILRLCRPVYVAALRRADPQSKESYRLSIKRRN